MESAKYIKDLLPTIPPTYEKLKEKYPQHVIVFRFGSVCACYGKDAVNAGRVLNIETFDKNGTQTLGFEYYGLNFLEILLKAEHKVILVENR